MSLLIGCLQYSFMKHRHSEQRRQSKSSLNFLFCHPSTCLPQGVSSGFWSNLMFLSCKLKLWQHSRDAEREKNFAIEKFNILKFFSKKNLFNVYRNETPYCKICCINVGEILSFANGEYYIATLANSWENEPKNVCIIWC